MDRLGLVAAPGGRGWRVYAAPVAFLLAATLVIGLLRGQAGGKHGAAKRTPVVHVRHTTPPAHRAPTVYVVRAGDTLSAISSRTGVPLPRLVALNPKVSPTALFIGEKLDLR